MKKWVIDFETRSKADLKKVGAYKYALDPSTVVLCLCYKEFDKPTQVGLWIPEMKEPPRVLIEAIENGDEIHAHNAAFEFNIWNSTCTRLYGFPKLKQDQLFCTLAQASALALPRALEQLGPALGTSKLKDKAGHNVMLQLSKPRKPTKNNPSIWFDDFDKFQTLFAYCEDDVLTEEACKKEMYPLTDYERKVYLLDQKINGRGVYCDIDLCKKALGFIDKYKDELLLELEFLTNGELESTSQLEKTLSYLRDKGLVLDNLRAATVADTLERTDLNDNARRVLEIRQLTSKTSVKKFNAMINFASDKDQRIRGMLLYHAATTGRFGGKGVQPQNFTRGSLKPEQLKPFFNDFQTLDYERFKTKYPDVIDALSSGLRGMLRAKPGNDFIAADFASIESRVLFWVAGAKAGLQAYETHGKVYEDLATSIFNVDLEDVTKDQRFIGKQGILGLGYQMGWKKFKESCALFKREITTELAKSTVDTYRSKYRQVPKLWSDQQKAAIHAVENKVITKSGYIKWGCKGNYLFCKLPSGRKLAYYKPHIVNSQTIFGVKKQLAFFGVNSQTRKFERQYTYGGKLVENIVQGIARDLLVEALFRIEEKGYRTVFHVHDEIVTEQPVGRGSLDEVCDLMAVVPEWAEGLPIAVSGWRDERFKKD